MTIRPSIRWIPSLVLLMSLLVPSWVLASDTNSPVMKGLDDNQQKLFQEIAEEQFCPCGNPQSFYESLKKPEKCPDAIQLGRFLAKKIIDGGSKRRLVKALLGRIATINSRVSLSTPADAPRVGPADAPLNIVVFSDFQCPFCSRIGAPLKELIDKNKDMAMYYKYYPLPMHPQAKSAAQAACAAHLQGKFWKMHDALFAAQDKLPSGDFNPMAKDVKLNLKTYEKDRMSVKCLEAVEKDIEEGNQVQLQGTPSIYLNGLLINSLDELQGAIDEARAFELAP
jgi:protein-disulfide isomerase